MGLGDGTLGLDMFGEILAMPQENGGIEKDVVIARHVATFKKMEVM